MAIMNLPVEGGGTHALPDRIDPAQVQTRYVIDGTANSPSVVAASPEEARLQYSRGVNPDHDTGRIPTPRAEYSYTDPQTGQTWDSNSKNTRLDRMPDGSFAVTLKTGDKVGGVVSYGQDGNIQPESLQSVRWNTNSEQAKHIATVAPFAAAGMIAGPMLGQALTSALNGTFPSLAASGALGEAAAAAAPAAASGTAAPSSMLSGMLEGGLTGGAGVGAPGAGLLPTGAAGTLGAGAGATGASTLGAGLLPTGTAGTLGGTFSGLTQIGATTLPLGGSLGGLSEGALLGMPGSAPSNWLETLRNALPGNAGDILGAVGDRIPDLLDRFGGPVAEVIAGRNADRQGRLDSEAQHALDLEYGRGMFDSANAEANVLRDLASRYGTVGGSFNNGVGRGAFDPATGAVDYTLNAPYQEQRDRMFGAAGDVFGQMQDFNPQTFAQQRYDAGQALMAEGRAQQEQRLMQDLFQKGGFGLTLNQGAAAAPGAAGTATAGQGTVGVNPYVDTFMNARNRQDAQLSVDSLRQGENYLDNLISRQQGLFSAGQGIDTYGAQAGTSAVNASNTANLLRGQEYQRLAGITSMPHQAQQRYLQDIYRANSGLLGREAGANATTGNTYSDAVGNLPYGDIWRTIRSVWGG